MDTPHPFLDELVGTPTMSEEDPFAVRGNTRTVRVWHTQNGPLEKEGNTCPDPALAMLNLTKHAAEAKRQAALEREEAARERAGFDGHRARYHVSSAEWDRAERQWRSWIAQRKAEDYIYAPHSSPAADKVEQAGIVGEARFSKVVAAQHHGCILCEAMNTTWAHPALSEAEKTHRIRKLAHRDPKLQLFPPSGNLVARGARGELDFEELVGASAWRWEPARPQNSEAQARGWKHGFENSDEFLRATEDLLRRTGGSKEVSEALADVRELDQDLAELEKMQESLQTRIEFARKGYSVLKIDNKMCKDRREFYPTATFQKSAHGSPDLERRERIDVDGKGGIDDKERGVGGEVGNRPFVRAGEKDAVSGGSPARVTLIESPEPQTEGPGIFFKAMQDFSRHTREQKDNASASTDDDPFRYDTREAIPATQGATGPSSEVAAVSWSKGVAKKDSKVEELLKKDGVSLKDFAAMPEQSKPKLRKLSVNHGPSSRPKWKV